MKKNNKKILIILLCLVCLVFTLSFTYTKYIHNSVWNYYLKTKKFYFSSDDLSINNKKNSNLSWDGSDIKFNIKNNLNEKEITGYDIDYDVSCKVLGDESSYIDCYITDSNSDNYSGTLSGQEICINNTTDGVDVDNLTKKECEISNYTWYNQSTTKELYFNLKLTDNTKKITDVQVEILAISKHPYKLELIGTYTIHKFDSKNNLLIYKLNDYSDYSNLLLSNISKEEKCVNLKWDSDELKIDINTDNLINYSTDDNSYINDVNIKLESKKSLSIDFYKVDNSKKYTIDDIKIIELENCS